MIRKAVTGGGSTVFLWANLEALVREKSAKAEEMEERMTATLDRIARDLFRVQRAQQAQFAVTHTDAPHLYSGTTSRSNGSSGCESKRALSPVREICGPEYGGRLLGCDARPGRP